MATHLQFSAPHGAHPIHPWLRQYAPVQPGRPVLVCLPHAGGSASTFRWPNLLAGQGISTVAVQYPGHQDRLLEPLAQDLAELVDGVVAAIQSLEATSVLLFGHSLGASVGYEAAVRLTDAGPPPSLLVASARRAPQLCTPRPPRNWTDQELLHDVRSLATPGSPDIAALDDPELRELILPILRADYRIVDGYRPTLGRKLPIPVLALTGVDDSRVSAGDLAAWSAVTECLFTMRSYPGGHFFLDRHRDQILTDIADQATAAEQALAAAHR